MREIIFWLAEVIILFIIEAATVNLVSIWFALGSAAALIIAIAGGALWLQIVLFIIVSAATLMFTRPLVKKYVNPKRQATNADMVFEKPCIVTEQIYNDAGHGTVSCGGKLWTARSDNGSVIPAGTKVKVMSIEGVKLLVVPESGGGK